MGPRQHTLPSKRSLGSRVCLRKGCGRVFQAVCWNQRYCQDADCLREVRRWQAAKRQRACRQSPANRERHAEAERQRRLRASRQPASVRSENSENTTADGGAWSRSKMNPKDFCNRPGCYEPLPTDTRAPARYCGRDCRLAVRRVLDRERKWLLRHHYATRGTVRAASGEEAGGRPPAIAGEARKNAARPVGDYRADSPQRLSSSRFDSQRTGSGEHDEHSETHSRRRSRPPPAG